MTYVLVASKAYLDQHGAPTSPEALAQHRCICLRHAELGGSWSMQRGAQTAHVAVHTRVTINNSAAVMAAVEADGGIGLVSDFAARAALDSGRVCQVLADWQVSDPHRRTIHAVYIPGRHIALKMRALIDYLAMPTSP